MSDTLALSQRLAAQVDADEMDHQASENNSSNSASEGHSNGKERAGDAADNDDDTDASNSSMSEEPKQNKRGRKAKTISNSPGSNSKKPRIAKAHRENDTRIDATMSKSTCHGILSKAFFRHYMHKKKHDPTVTYPYHHVGAGVVSLMRRAILNGYMSIARRMLDHALEHAKKVTVTNPKTGQTYDALDLRFDEAALDSAKIGLKNAEEAVELRSTSHGLLREMHAAKLKRVHVDTAEAIRTTVREKTAPLYAPAVAAMKRGAELKKQEREAAALQAAERRPPGAK